jgi:hypothetical protein
MLLLHKARDIQGHTRNTSIGQADERTLHASAHSAMILMAIWRKVMLKRGIRLRRDNWVSVRYAEELNSGKSSGTPQRTDRHGMLGEKLTDLQVSL